VIEFKVKDRESKRYEYTRHNIERETPTRQIVRKGKSYDIGGEEVELFTAGVLLEAIDRTRMWLFRMERDGLFPKPMYTIDVGKRVTRYYSASQIMNLHFLMWGKYSARKNHTFDKDEFSKDVLKVFYERDVIVETDGRIRKRKKQ
jgi:hypothetical protein